MIFTFSCDIEIDPKDFPEWDTFEDRFRLAQQIEATGGNDRGYGAYSDSWEFFRDRVECGCEDEYIENVVREHIVPEIFQNTLDELDVYTFQVTPEAKADYLKHILLGHIKNCPSVDSTLTVEIAEDLVHALYGEVLAK